MVRFSNHIVWNWLMKMRRWFPKRISEAIFAVGVYMDRWSHWMKPFWDAVRTIDEKDMIPTPVLEYAVLAVRRRISCPVSGACKTLVLTLVLVRYRFSAFWLRSKCSICSYQLNIWYGPHWGPSILNWFLNRAGDAGVYSGPSTRWLGLAVPPRPAHSLLQGGNNKQWSS